MRWTRIFRYRHGVFDLWEYISFTFCYAGFLWFATDEDLAWFKFYSEKSGIQSALEQAYKKIGEREKTPKRNVQKEREAYDKGYYAPLNRNPNLYNSRDKENFAREYWEENRRWQHYGLTPKEMDRRRKITGLEDNSS